MQKRYLQFVNGLRDAMVVDSLQPCGLYFGTTGGQIYASADAGNSWTSVVEICRRCCPLKSNHCHDPDYSPGPPAEAGKY